MSVFAKLRHFSEFHIALAALSDLNKAEAALVASQGRLFGEDFRHWSRSQKLDDLNPALTEIVQAGTQQVKVNRETAKNLENLGRDLQPLLTQESERTKRHEACASAQEDAERSAAVAEKAEAAFARIQNSGKAPEVAKVEVAAQAARAKADRDRDIAADLRGKLDGSEAEYRRKFLESLVTPLAAALAARHKTAETLAALAADFDAAAGHIQETVDPTIAKYQEQLDELDQVVVE
jgi:hypothetical protein